MKKLGKLSINPEKLIKNDELVNLRGGYEGGYGSQKIWNCYCGFETGTPTFEICAGDTVEALQAAGDLCAGQGATCSGTDKDCSVIA